MKKRPVTIFILILLLVFVPINSVYAAEESFPSKFLGSPLLALTVIIIIDIIALLYRKIRK